MSKVLPAYQSLDELKTLWAEQWPAALSTWSKFIQLTDPRWCITEEEEQHEHLSGSFAMIRLVDHAVVISLRQVDEMHLSQFAVEILAHEIGHHVLCPANLTDNARMMARMRRGLPTKEHLAGFIGNLYGDLLINDRLQRSAGLQMADVYRAIDKASTDKLWTFYMRMYEVLWQLPRGELAHGEIDRRLEYDAQLGARLIRSYAQDWLAGSGRFAALCLRYLIDDEGKEGQRIFGRWSDTAHAGAGGLPDGMTEIDPDEIDGAIHPSEDAELSGMDLSDTDSDDDGKEAATIDALRRGRNLKNTGHKTPKQFRQPFEYAELMRASGAVLDAAQIIARYYRERATPYLVPFPSRRTPPSTEQLPEALETWDIGEPLEQIDWLGSLTTSPIVVPGMTTRQREFGTSPGDLPDEKPLDLYLGVDCSGSMGNPADKLSYPVLAGAVIALSALRAGAKVKVVLSGEPGSSIATDGFVRDPRLVLGTLTSYLGTGYSFGIHRLAETFDDFAPNANPAHILIVSDSDIFSMLDSPGDREIGWDVARRCVAKARGGGTYALEISERIRQSWGAKQTNEMIPRMQTDGWQVSLVSSMEELVEFARKFARMKYGEERQVAVRKV